MSTALTVMADKLAKRFDMEQDGDVLVVLKQTAFRSDKEVSDAQMTALLVVANQYGLNPFTKELYAFPDKRGGIVPVVGVDGWARIINEHPQFDGMDFEWSADDASYTCTMYRKDRAHPTRVTEYLQECKRSTDPWTSHPRRMLRHKAMIQCARLAFGFVGIHDQDEAERILGVIDCDTGEIKPQSLVPQSKSAQQQAAADAAWQADDGQRKAKERAEAKAGAEDVTIKDKQAPAGAIIPGQVKWIEQKLAALELGDESRTALLSRHGIAALDTSITTEQFDALKAELMAAA